MRRPALAERLALVADTAVGLPPPFPGAYMDVWVGLVRARAVIAAVRLGVFGALPGTTDELAARCGCRPDRLEVLLEALAALRYVRRGRAARGHGARGPAPVAGARRAGAHATTPGACWRATRRARSAFGPDAAVRLDATVGELAAANAEQLRGLEDVLRGADPPGLHDGVADGETFAGYQAAMVELMAVSGPALLGHLDAPRTLLDLGGGPGTFAALACARWPELNVTVAEFPDAAALGRERIAAAGLADRVTYVEGDARTSPVGTGYDVTTLNNLLHNVDRDTGVGLLAAAGRAARRVVVLELEGTGTQVGTLASLSFMSWMGSRAWTGPQLEAMARDAGLTAVRLHRPVRLNGSVVLSADGLRDAS